MVLFHLWKFTELCSYDIYIFCIHVIPQGKVISESILYTALLLILKYLLNIHIYAPLYQILKEVEYTDIVPVSCTFLSQVDNVCEDRHVTA